MSYLDYSKQFLESIDFAPPTIDRPFGIYLWDVFVQVSKALFDWDPSKFEFIPGQLPLSTPKPVALLIGFYYVVIFGGREIMRSRPALKLTVLFRIHNMILTLISLSLLALLAEQLFPIIYRHGIFYAICDEGSWTQPIVTLYYLTYLSKYVEFIDTVFLFAKKKPLTFLHCYHHGATAFLCYTQLVGHTSVSWVPITLNLGVHVLMYWYYFLSSCGIRVWWKEWVTRFQIIQFVIDLFFVYFATYTYFTATYYPWLPTYGSCFGEEFAAFYGCAILTSYLFLFIAFYINVYIKGKKSKAAKSKTLKSAITPVKSSENGKTAPAPAPAAKKHSKKV
ncbi:GNS1/SUR4 family-domain-containing protein [Lipomyces oligophaga]|uniref:GNS1/SUR4 family-domain-containing protein n=1 Tax=Lipomyces oligophaga TaxID=45792 RepID=UPI0034CE1C5C